MKKQVKKIKINEQIKKETALIFVLLILKVTKLRAVEAFIVNEFN